MRHLAYNRGIAGTNPNPPAATVSTRAGSVLRYVRYAFVAVALAYAFFAGLRTVSELDLGWQMATARWILQHHSIPSTDVLSYTARGNEWIYPPGAGFLFLLLFRIGGYAALSWLTAAACVATVALLVRRGGVTVALLAAIAVPSVAYRTAPRAELFTTIFFAAFISILWQYYRTGRGALWALPLLMLSWVNLHLGFVAGLAALAAYLVLEVFDLPFSDRRAGVRSRLGRAAPWLVVTCIATFVNPWGPKVVGAIARQNQIMTQHVDVIGEWAQPPLSAAGLRQALMWRDPESGYWWLLAAALLAIIVALWQRRFGAVIVLAAATAASLKYLRVQGLFAAITVIIGGAVLAELRLPSRNAAKHQQPQVSRPTAPPNIAAVVALVLLAAFVGIRAADLVSDRFYIDQTSLFGTGESWWFPERASAFLDREQLPGHVFNTYNLGGFLTWRLPQYPDYIDGRAVPFGPALFYHARSLMQQSPDSPAWQQEATERGINFVFLPISRYLGLSGVPLRAWCQSRMWQAVYIDTVSAVFVRRAALPPDRLAQLSSSGGCDAILTTPPSAYGITPSSPRGLAFNFYINRGSILYVLGHDAEALADLSTAGHLYPGDANIHLILGEVLQAGGSLADAEREYRLSVQLHPSDIGWYALGVLFAQQQRYADAANAIRNSAGLSYQESFERYRLLGRIYLAMNDAHRALAAFDEAEKREPLEIREHGNEFKAQLAEARGRAWGMLGDNSRALQYQQQAVELTPNSAVRWNDLAIVYDAVGDKAKAADARSHAAALKPR